MSHTTMTHRLRTAVLAAAAILVLTAAPARAGKERRLEWRGSAEGIRTLALDVAVGDVTVRGEPDATGIVIRVTLIPRRSGMPLFGSTRRGEREIAGARLGVERDGDELEVELEGVDDDDRHFEERWEVTVPQRLALELDLGVGDVVVRGVRGGVEIDNGVGDISVERCPGNLEIEAGVGDVEIAAEAASAGAISVSSGVGSCAIHLPGGRTLQGDGLGCELSWKGGGEAAIAVECGVGDAVVTVRGASR